MPEFFLLFLFLQQSVKKYIKIIYKGFKNALGIDLPNSLLESDERKSLKSFFAKNNLFHESTNHFGKEDCHIQICQNW